MAVLGRGSCFGALTPPPTPTMEASVYAMGTVKCAVLRVECMESVLGSCFAMLAHNGANVEGNYQQLLAEGSLLGFANLRL